MPETTVNGARIAYDEYGSGPAVVLIHGLGGNRTDVWRHVTAPLARDYRVVAYDMRGSGESEIADGPYTIDLLADDVDGLLGALGIERAALVGHSMGGAIALTEAARRPERVWGVAGVGTAATLTAQQREGMQTRAETVEAEGMGAIAETVATNGTAPSFREQHAEDFQELISMLASNDPAGYAAQCRSLVTMAVEGLLPSVRAPVLLVAGELDAVSPPEVNEATAAALASARVEVIADCAHIVPREKPDELLAALRPFLAEHSA
jgi:3-oxoadipate enol-lactonase